METEKKLLKIVEKKSESSFKAKLVRILNNQSNTFVFPTTPSPFSHAGISDIVGVCEGKFVAIELKRIADFNKKPLNLLSEPQSKFLRDVWGAGGVAIVIGICDDGTCVIKNLTLFTLDHAASWEIILTNFKDINIGNIIHRKC